MFRNFLLFSFLLTAQLPASYYYIKLGTATPPIYQKGALPTAGFGARLKSSYLDLDLSLAGSSKKKTSYIAAKGLLLIFIGEQFYIGAGAGMGYGAKAPIVKMLQGKATKTSLVTFESVIGYECYGRFIQMEFSKPVARKRSHHSHEDWGISVMLGTCI